MYRRHACSSSESCAATEASPSLGMLALSGLVQVTVIVGVLVVKAVVFRCLSANILQSILVLVLFTAFAHLIQCRQCSSSFSERHRQTCYSNKYGSDTQRFDQKSQRKTRPFTTRKSTVAEDFDEL